MLKRTPQYFDALIAYQEGDAAPIAERFIEAALFASAWNVVPHLVAHPVLDARFLMRHLSFNEVTAQRTLAQLVEHGVLEERSGFKRNRAYQHAGILRVLDAYAQQLHRQ